MSSQKSYQPTKKRLDQARKKGQVAKSILLTQAFTMSFGLLALWHLLGLTWVRNKILLEYIWLEGLRDLGSAMNLGGRLLLETLGAVFMVTAGIALLSETLQIGFKFDPSLLSPRAERLSPSKGILKMLKGLSEIPLLCTKLMGAFGVLLCCLWQIFYTMLQNFNIENATAGIHAWRTVLMSGILTVGAFGIIDFTWKRRSYMRNLMMSLTEIKQEAKEDEGDPHFKAHRRSLHEALLMQDLVRKVRNSKVIVVERMATRNANR